MTKISNQYSLTNILTADLANSRLGINNVSPTVALDVTGAGKFSGALTGTSATFSGSVGVGGSVDTYQQMTITASTAYTVLGLYNTAAGSTQRNWSLATNDIAAGDFTIRQSGAAGGNPFAGGGVVRLMVNATGNVGIGTSSPSSAGGAFTGLDIRGSSGGSLIMGSTSTAYAFMYGENTGFYIQTPSGIPLNFLTSATERMRITSNGNLGIGTSAPTVKFQLEAPTTPYGQFYILNTGALSGESTIHFGRTSQTNEQRWTVGQGTAGIGDSFGFYTSASNKAVLTTAGVWSTAGGGTSDLRKKQNVEYIQTDGIESIKLLKPAKFEFKDNPEKTRRGFIAQDVLEVIPNLVLGDGELEGGTYGLDYDGILALAVKAIQELSAKVSLLENK